MILHLFKFDVLRCRTVLLVWLGLVLVHSSLAVIVPHPGDQSLRIAIQSVLVLIPLLEAIMFVVVVPQLIQTTPLVGTTAFWFSRPIARTELLGAKALSIASLILLPTLVHIGVLASAGATGSDIAKATVETLITGAGLIVMIATIAALTPDFGRFALAGAVLIVASVLLAIGAYWLTSSRLIPTVPDQIDYYRVAAIPLFSIVAFGGTITYQYLTRRTGVALALALGVFILPWALTLAPWHPLLWSGPATPALPHFSSPSFSESLRISSINDVSLVANRTAKMVEARFSSDGLEAGQVAIPKAIHAQILTTAGLPVAGEAVATPFVNLGYPQATAVSAALGGVPVVNGETIPYISAGILKMDPTSFQAYANQPVTVKADAEMEIARYKIVSEIPLALGAKWKSGAKKDEIGAILHEGTGIEVELHIQRLKLMLNPDSTLITSDFNLWNSRAIYVLCNRKLNQALLTKMAFRAAASLAGPFANLQGQLQQSTISLAFGAENYRLAPDLTDAWLADATLVRLELESVATTHVQIVAENQSLGSPTLPPYRAAAKPPFDPVTYARIQLPLNPTKAQAREYVDSLLAISQHEPYIGPLTDKLKAVTHANLDVLVDIQSSVQPGSYTQAIDEAVSALAQPQDKATILAALAKHHELIEVVIRYHWETDAKATLVAVLNSPTERYLPRQWSLIVAQFKDPSTYPALKAYLVRTVNRQVVFNQIHKLPGIDLQSTIDEAWARAKLDGLGEMRNCAGFAAVAGHTDALGVLIDVLRGKEVRGNEAERALTYARRATEVPGGTAELVAWYDANAGHLVYDPETHKYTAANK